MANIELGFFGLFGIVLACVFYGTLIAFIVLLFKFLINANKALKIYISKNENQK